MKRACRLRWWSVWSVACCAAWLAMGVSPLHAEPATQPAREASTAPAATQPSVDPAVAKVLAMAESRTKDVADLTAGFTQTRTMMLLRKPLVSTGRVNMRQGVTRWTTQKPQRQVMRTSPGRIEIFHPDQKLLEVYEVDPRLTDLTASPLPRLQLLRRYFDITLASQDEHIATLHFTPRQKELARHIHALDATMDLRTGLARRIVITNADDETTVIEFTDVRTNVRLDASDVALALPEGTRITRPLEGGAPTEGSKQKTQGDDPS